MEVMVSAWKIEERLSRKDAFPLSDVEFCENVLPKGKERESELN